MKRCKAINACGYGHKGEKHLQGKRCSRPALALGRLCWLHNTIVEAQLATEAQVLSGKRPR